MEKVHQIYGKIAIRVACGRKITNDIKTSLPGAGVTCKTCNKVEKSRRTDAKILKKKMVK